MPPKNDLLFLASHPNSVFTRNDLLDEVWDFFNISVIQGLLMCILNVCVISCVEYHLNGNLKLFGDVDINLKFLSLNQLNKLLILLLISVVGLCYTIFCILLKKGFICFLKKILPFITIVILCVGVIAFTDLIVRPGYFIKALVKLPIFLFCLFYTLFSSKILIL